MAADFIRSHEACVVAATAACQHCGAQIEVVCIHCFGGTVADRVLERFTVSDIREVDPTLARQLALWPNFRQGAEAGAVFTNHCPRCGEVQDEALLHSEPGQPFFDVATAIAADRVTCIPLVGTVTLSGSAHSRKG